MLHNDSAHDMEEDGENYARVQPSQLQAALGAKLENMFGKLFNTVSFFVIFYNLVNVLHDLPAATKVRIQRRGFLKMRDTKAKTALDKFLSCSTLSCFLQGA